MPPCRSRTGPSPISPATARAASIPSSAASRGTAAPRRSCSTATGRRRATPSSISAAPSIRPTTGFSPGAPTSRARSTSPSACATSRPARSSRTRSRRPPGKPSGRADSSGFYYVELDENHRPVRVKRHRLGDARRQPTRSSTRRPTRASSCISGTTQSGAFVVIVASDHETSEIRLLDRARPKARAAPRRAAHAANCSIRRRASRRRRSSSAPTPTGRRTSRSSTAPVATPGRANWRDLVPSRPGMMMLSHVALARYLVRLEREDAKPRIVVRDIDSGREEADRLRRGGLFARHRRRLRVRHRHDPLFAIPR